MGFPDSSLGKESACDTGDPSSIPGLGRSAGEGEGCPLQYSGLENSMDYAIHGVAKSLSDFHFLGEVRRRGGACCFQKLLYSIMGRMVLFNKNDLN